MKIHNGDIRCPYPEPTVRLVRIKRFRNLETCGIMAEGTFRGRLAHGSQYFEGEGITTLEQRVASGAVVLAALIYEQAGGTTYHVCLEELNRRGYKTVPFELEFKIQISSSKSK